MKALENQEVLIVAEDPHEEKKTNSTYRFFANSLPGRAVESTFRTALNTTKVQCLSPWGDNNPVILPTIRRRDVVLLGIDLGTGGATAAVGAVNPVADYFLSATITGAVVGAVANDYISQKLLEDPAGKYLDRQDIERMNLSSDKILVLLVSIKHKLHNVTAALSFYNAPQATQENQSRSSGKMRALLKGDNVLGLLSPSAGWFSPYLMSTHRLPAIPRTEHPSIVMCYGPFLPGDYLLAHHLAASIPRLLPLCNPDPDVDLPHQRLLITIAGIKPFRGNVWTSSRRPDEGKLKFVLGDRVPAIIIPVRDGTPLVSWGTTTLREGFHRGIDSWKALSVGVLAFLYEVIDWKATSHSKQNEAEDVLRAAVDALLAAAWELKGNKDAKKRLDADRAGVVFLRYDNRSMFVKEQQGRRLWDWRKRGATGTDKPVPEE